jgi:monooxygenase
LSPTDLDVLVVGAGLSGIGAAYYLQRAFPHRSYAILEARGASGGTWDLFRYPGVRSDSDMFTLCFRFRPWAGGQAITDGATVLAYLRETVAENHIDDRIRYHHRVVRADWSCKDERWTVDVERTDTGTSEQLTCRFLFACTGYYRYDAGYTPTFPGAEEYQGEVVHPQHWPAGLDCSGKRVVVIGSGATAVSLIPAIAAQAAHVTMLQRSPSYILSQPAGEGVLARSRMMLPARTAYRLSRSRHVALQVGFYELCRRRPALARWLLLSALRRQLPAGFDVETHFTPRYDPWDQRLCVVPGGDLFAAIRAGSVEVVTEEVDRFTTRGVRLRSGRELDADVVVTATGLALLALGGIRLGVDGREVELARTMAYKGLMLSEVPNFAFTMGYTNASWTLKAELVCEYVVRLIAHMEREGHSVAVPRRDPRVAEAPFIDLTSGYVQRSMQHFPKQGTAAPWRLRMNYLRDARTLRSAPVDDGVMTFLGRAGTTPA